MIIKKTNFNLAGRRFKGNWPFTVDQVAVLKTALPGVKPACYAILHEYRLYALSGLLESHGLPNLEKSGIWKPDGELKVNLSAFFEYVMSHSELITNNGE